MTDLREKERWAVRIFYTDGAIDNLKIEEIEDLHDIVEQGVDWNELHKIEIRYALGNKQ